MVVKKRKGKRFGNLSDKEWKSNNSSIEDIKNVKLADFQYKINYKNFSDKLVFIQNQEDK